MVPGTVHLGGIIAPMTYRRDPVSQMFDTASRRALRRCYAAQGRWVAVRLPRLTARLFIRWLTRGEDLRAADPWDDSIDRYVRGFVRACYHNHRWYGDWGGLRDERRAAPWDGLALVYRADRTPTGWRVRLMTAPKGDRRLPRKAKRFKDPERVSPPVRGF